MPEGKRMKVLLFGATGMVWQGVLRECLLDADVEGGLAVGRGTTGQQHEKLREIVEQSRARSAVYDVITNAVPVSIEIDAG